MFITLQTIINFLMIIISINTAQMIQSEIVCKSQIYCMGELLRTVQLSKLFKDSKTFVDMPLVYSPEVTLNNFEYLKAKTRGKPRKEDLIEFVGSNFKTNNRDELQLWIPPDFKKNPKFLKRIENKEIKHFAKKIAHLWSILGRKVGKEVETNPQKFSIIPVPNGFIIPGGRFRELYYWDSYWIIKGLLICDMTKTAKGMIENFFHLISEFGFVPNGGRIYYLDRSQPPLLTLMVSDYVEVTADWGWLERNLKYLDREMRFWLDHKTVKIFKNGRFHSLAHYGSRAADPRPESYREDFLTASKFPKECEKVKFYQNVRSATESGWDFSSRWFFGRNLTTMRPSRTIPVDLNAILCRNFKILHNFYQKFGNEKVITEFWLEQAEKLEKAIKEILYDEEEGIWFDYDTICKKQRKQFYASNFAPLWLGIFDHKDKNFGEKAANYLRKNRILSEFPGGVPSSLSESGEQWDYPNAWPPCQSMVIFGLENTGNEEAKEIAKILAQKWITSAFNAYNRTNEIFEKYNALFEGTHGTGGEYQVQTGFGWTNGGILELIDYYYGQNKILL